MRVQGAENAERACNHGLAAKLMEDLGADGAHPGAESGGKNYCG
jgi:hypothetical protein